MGGKKASWGLTGLVGPRGCHAGRNSLETSSFRSPCDAFFALVPFRVTCCGNDLRQQRTTMRASRRRRNAQSMITKITNSMASFLTHDNPSGPYDLTRRILISTRRSTTSVSMPKCIQNLLRFRVSGDVGWALDPRERIRIRCGYDFASHDGLFRDAHVVAALFEE